MPMRDGQMAGVAHMADLLVCVGGTGSDFVFVAPRKTAGPVNFSR
jgi:hypothetical protein